MGRVARRLCDGRRWCWDEGGCAGGLPPRLAGGRWRLGGCDLAGGESSGWRWMRVDGGAEVNEGEEVAVRGEQFTAEGRRERNQG